MPVESTFQWAKRIGINKYTLEKYLKGEPVRIASAKRLAKLLRVPLNSINTNIKVSKGLTRPTSKEYEFAREWNEKHKTIISQDAAMKYDVLLGK